MYNPIKAIYAGSFDPFTTGHLDIIKRSLGICTQLIIGIGVNPAKKTLFSAEERVDMIQGVLIDELSVVETNKVSVFMPVAFEGLLVDFAKKHNANILIRGIRSVTDFEYEMNLAHINKLLAPNIDTVFLPAAPELSVVSSSMVKEIARYGGDIKSFVPAQIADAVYTKLNNIAK